MKANPAFPIPRIDKDETVHWGLTKREYFAAIILQGMLSSLAGQNPEYIAQVVPLVLVENSIKIADTLLEKLEE